MTGRDAAAGRPATADPASATAVTGTVDAGTGTDAAGTKAGSGPGPVACIGLGNMGLSMAKRLLGCGCRVAAWNRSEGPTRAVAEAGARVAATPAAAAAGARYVVVSTADDAALEATARRPDGFLGGLDDRSVVVVASTVAPDAVRSLADQASATGAAVVDAGVLGNPGHAARGQLRVFLGGDDAAVEQALPLAHTMGKEVRHVGPLGAGMQLKLVLNLVMGLEMQTLAEAAALAEALGLDRAETLEVIGGSGFASPVMAFKARRMATGDYGDPDFRLALMAKDVGHATSAAAGTGTPLPLSEVAAATLARAVDRGLGELDCAAVARALPEGSPSAGPPERAVPERRAS